MKSLKNRIFGIIMFVVIATELVLSLLMGWVLLDTQEKKTLEELRSNLTMLAQSLSYSGDEQAAINALTPQNIRVTWIDNSGKVLYDSSLEHEAGTDNHQSRPEFIDALQTGQGSAVRMSSTLGEVSYYQSMRLDDGSVLRLSETQNHAFSLVTGLIIPAIALLCMLALIAAAVARLLTQRIIAPLYELDLDKPLANKGYDELSFLLRRIDDQKKRIIAESERSLATRREFTANVSHELKTPLTVISGYAELMMHKQTDPDDTPHFASLIHSETEHMRELVEDVLILSQLDELGTTKPRNDEMASLNLYTIVNDCIDRLTPFADQMNVAFHLKKQGETQVCGSAQILSSMVYNLCENAIRYNQEGGSVNIDLSSQDDAVRLSIADTGIGISADEQQRVFERFYRVDRTRSRLTGGTGLGLAIVKHGANYHGATLSLSSTPGKGSCITISFPIAAH